jgi:hypothetical protein
MIYFELQVQFSSMDYKSRKEEVKNNVVNIQEKVQIYFFQQ